MGTQLGGIEDVDNVDVDFLRCNGFMCVLVGWIYDWSGVFDMCVDACVWVLHIQVSLNCVDYTCETCIICIMC